MRVEKRVGRQNALDQHGSRRGEYRDDGPYYCSTFQRNSAKRLVPVLSNSKARRSRKVNEDEVLSPARNMLPSVWALDILLLLKCDADRGWQVTRNLRLQCMSLDGDAM